MNSTCDFLLRNSTRPYTHAGHSITITWICYQRLSPHMHSIESKVKHQLNAELRSVYNANIICLIWSVSTDCFQLLVCPGSQCLMKNPLVACEVLVACMVKRLIQSYTLRPPNGMRIPHAPASTIDSRRCCQRSGLKPCTRLSAMPLSGRSSRCPRCCSWKRMGQPNGEDGLPEGASVVPAC